MDSTRGTGPGAIIGAPKGRTGVAIPPTRGGVT